MSRRTEPMETYPSNTKTNPIPPLRPAGTNRTHRGTAQHRRTSARTKRQTELQADDAGTPGTKYRIAAVAAKLWKEGAKLRCIRRNGKPRNDRDNGGKSIPECEYRRRQSRGYE